MHDAAAVAALALPAVTGLGLVALAAIVARTGWAHVHNRLFAALYTLSGVKSVADGLTAAAGPGMDAWADGFHASSPLFPEAATWNGIDAGCSFLMLPLLALFVSRFPHPAAWTVAHPRRQLLPFLLTVVLAALDVWPPKSSAPWVNLPWLLVASAVAGTAVTIFAVVMLVRARRTATPVELRQTRYMLAGFLPSFAATWIITLLLGWYGTTGSPEALAGIVWTQSYVSPVIELAAAALVAYAILKYRVLAVELRVKGGVKYAIMTVTVSGVLFLVATYVGNFVLQNRLFSFAGPQGSAILAGLGGMVLFKPVEKVAARLSDRLFPEAAGPRALYDRRRAREIYLAEVTQVARDGQLTPGERRLLRRLQEELGLDAPTAREVEDEAQRTLGITLTLDAPVVA